jgi:hypothetical protein
MVRGSDEYMAMAMTAFSRWEECLVPKGEEAYCESFL